MIDYAKRIAELRGEKGWTFKTASENTGLSTGILKTIETEKGYQPNITTLQKIAEGYGIELDELVSRDDVMDRKTKTMMRRFQRLSPRDRSLVERLVFQMSQPS